MKLSDLLAHLAANADNFPHDLGEIEVVAAHESSSTPSYTPWPGPQKNVNAWYELANGKSIGVNENPARGITFPVVSTVQHKYQIGQKVLLVPESGSYQRNITGEIVSITNTQVGVKRPDKLCVIKYRISDGKPVAKYDQQFPCYSIAQMQEDEKAQ